MNQFDFINSCLVFQAGIIIIQKIKEKIEQRPKRIKQKTGKKIGQKYQWTEILPEMQRPKNPIDDNLSKGVQETENQYRNQYMADQFGQLKFQPAFILYQKPEKMCWQKIENCQGKVSPYLNRCDPSDHRNKK